MYSNLASVYEDIFPLRLNTLDFVRKNLPGLEGIVPRILDVGCATGELARTLATFGYDVTGLEPDGEMIAQAKHRGGQSVSFIKGGMENLIGRFRSGSFDGALCIGNTLAHLQSLKAIGQFFSDVRLVLKMDGRFIFQVVNFDKVNEETLPVFPVIENEKISFSRRYERIEGSELLLFETILRNRETGVETRGNSQLFPIGQGELSELLAHAGFMTQHWFGSYKGEPFDRLSPAAICVASR